MRTLNCLLILSLISGCATARTKTTDPVLRVAIDSESLSRGSYVRLQTSLMNSGLFVVVDRSVGFRAIAKEQELQQTTTRFGANEKYALWGKLYGVGGVFVGYQQCKRDHNWLGAEKLSCIENLSLLDASTGEVMAVAEAEEDTQDNVAAGWDTAIERLMARYPKVFIDKHDLHKNQDYDSALIEYREKIVPANTKPTLGMGPDDSIGE